MEPPEIVRYRKPKARLTQNNRRNINEYGLQVPSKKPENYEPNLNSKALLMNSGLLGSKPFNYKNQAKVNSKGSWNAYLQRRANANAKKKNNTQKNKNKNKNNGTRKALF